MSQPVIIDTNAFVSGILSKEPNSPLAKIFDGMLCGTIPFILSRALVDEYRQVLLRPKLLRLHGLTAEQIDKVLSTISVNGLWHEPKESISAPDPGDDHLWALLFAVPEAALITGDRLLIDNPPAFGRVMSPRDFLP